MAEYSLNRDPKPHKDHIDVTHINIRQSISLLIIKLIAIDVASAVVVGVLYLFLHLPLLEAVFQTDSTVVIFTFFGLLALSKIVLSAYIILDWLNEYYEVTPTSLIHRRGVFFTKEDKANFSDIRKIAVKQGALGKMLNYGTIALFDFMMEKDMYAYQIHNPIRYSRILEELIPEAEASKEVLRSVSHHSSD